MRLFGEAISKFFIGVFIVGLLLFLPGSLDYWQGWLFIFY